MWIKTNEEGYVIDFCDIYQNDESVEVPTPDDLIDFIGNWTNYRLIDGQLEKDTEAAEAEAKRKEIEAEIADLRQQLNDSADQVMEQLESLFAATTLAGFLTSLLEGARKLKTVLQERSNIRERIAELSK